ncbi:protein TIFY 10A-like isoform X2 [Eutrema salsugineum]|nr:protein TIFY 10A-like isoform X2 [Eutrema salsugineum]
MDLFPEQLSFHNPSSKQDLYTLPNYGTNKNMRQESHRAQVTMFYEGKVFVLSDLSSEKAEQILLLAAHEGTSSKIYTQLNQRLAPTTPHNDPNQCNRSVTCPSFQENVNQVNNFEVSMDHMTCELPIARRNSLHRFLEKRIDRCGGRGPYHSSGNHLAVVSQPRVENKWWLK